MEHLSDTWNPELGDWESEYMPDINIQMVDTHPDEGGAFEEAGRDEDLFRSRRPLIFDSGTDTLYVGGYNQTHEEAARAHGIQVWGYNPTGCWFPEGTQRGDPPGTISWFSDALKPNWKKAIRKKLNGEDEQNPWDMQTIARKEEWHKGQHGKGLLTKDGQLITWPVGDEGFGGPHHIEGMQDHGIKPEDLAAFVYLSPDGTFGAEAYPEDEPSDNYDLFDDMILQHPETRLPDDWDMEPEDPWKMEPVHASQSTIKGALSAENDGVQQALGINLNWNLSKTVKHMLDWDEGNEGKGVLMNDGSFHTWNVDDLRMPNHIAYMKEHGLYNTPQDLEDAKGFFEIGPDGRLYNADRWNDEALKVVDEAAALDPRLVPATGSHWALR